MNSVQSVDGKTAATFVMSELKLMSHGSNIGSHRVVFTPNFLQTE